MDRPPVLSHLLMKEEEEEAKEFCSNLKTRKISILDLPTEILLIIFSYLDAYSLLNRVALVCQKWNIISQDKSLWKSLSFDIKDKYINIADVVLKFAHLQELSIQQVILDSNFFESVAESLTNLHSLSLTYCKILPESENGFNILSRNLFSLKLLDLEGSEVCSEVLEKIQHLNALKQLNLSHCINLSNKNLICILENCTKLEYLDLDGINLLEDYAINSIFKIRSDTIVNLIVDGDYLSDKAFANLNDCSKLVKLYIAFCDNLTDKTLSHIMHFKNLKHLKLRKGSLFTPDGLGKLFKEGMLYNITHLNISECSLLNNANLIAIANCCQGLLSLSMAWCWELTDESVNYLIKKCPHIMIIDMTGLVRLQGAFILDLKQGCLKDLRVMDLEQCGCIKDEALEDLVRTRPSLKIFGFWGDIVTPNITNN